MNMKNIASNSYKMIFIFFDQHLKHKHKSNKKMPLLKTEIDALLDEESLDSFNF